MQNKHSRKAILAKRATIHAVMDARPQKQVINSNGLYCRLVRLGGGRGHQLIVNSTGKAAE